MIYTDDNYYLLAYTEGKFKHFRVDRMDKAEAMITEIAEVEVASIAREGAEEFAKKDMSAYTGLANQYRNTLVQMPGKRRYRNAGKVQKKYRSLPVG